MKTSIKFSVVIFITLLSIMFGHASNAQIIDVTQIDIKNIKNGHATVSWSTNVSARGIVYFGEQQNSLNFYVANNAYDQNHEADLTGLKENTVYYFKIVSYDALGNVNEAYIQHFETDDMEDNVAPIISDLHLVQKTDNAMLISWKTNEGAISRVEYGQEDGSYTQYVDNMSYDTKHFTYIYNLDPQTRYYLRIRNKDEAGNEKIALMTVETASPMGNKVLIAENIKPLSVDDARVFPEKVTISWRSAFVARSDLIISDKKTGQVLKYHVSRDPSLTHEITIDKLSANTTYYYRIVMYDGIYNFYFESRELSVTTKQLSPEYVRGLYKIGDLVRGDGGSVVYLLRSGNKILFTPEDFTRIGYDPARIKIIPAEHLSYFETRDSLYQVYQNEKLVKLAGDPSVYLISNGIRRAFFNATAFNRLGYNWMDVQTISLSELMKLNKGENIY